MMTPPPRPLYDADNQLNFFSEVAFPTMKTTITATSVNPLWIPPPIPNTKSILRRRLYNNHPIKPPRTVFESNPKSALIVKCSENSSLKDMLSGMVDERVEQLLNKEENRVLLDGLEQATRRVELAKKELAEIEKQEAEAKITRNYINQLESRASEIAECQKEIMEARMMVEEAERSLTDQGIDAMTKMGSEVMSKDEERLESLKAASIAAAIGTLAELPIALSRTNSINSQLILPLAITFVSCALFGVTFRYAIRRDLDNFHLKSGTYAAFGFVKGLGTLGGGPPLELEGSSIISHAFDGAVYVSESVLVFVFAGVALDFCIKLGFLSTFPSDLSAPKT